MRTLSINDECITFKLKPISSVLQTEIHKTLYLLQSYNVCAAILSVPSLQSYLPGRTRTTQKLPHLPQRGTEINSLMAVVVAVRWLWWPCTGTRAASTCVFLNCEDSQYVSVGLYLTEFI